MHVPLVINGPKFGVVAGRNDEPVCIADVSPTILELLGAAPLADIDGVSLAPLAKGGAGALPRQGVLAESHIPRLEYGWSGLRAWVRRDAKLIQAPRPEYFATADRGEASNLATQQPAAVSQALDELRGAVAAAEALGAGSAEQSASAEQQDLMRSLGYVSAGGRARDGDLVDARRTDPKDRREFEDLFDRAVLATQAGRIPEALELFDRLGRLEVDNPAVLFEHGQALIRAGQLPRAITIYERLLAVEPTSGPGWFRYGQLLDNTRRWEDAEAAYRKATSVDPNNVDAHKALGSLLIDRERIPEAIEVLERALALDPTDPAIRRDLEQLWQRTRR
jgi:tetratricopeptide (TPR) repeat protein